MKRKMRIQDETKRERERKRMDGRKTELGGYEKSHKRGRCLFKEHQEHQEHSQRRANKAVGAGSRAIGELLGKNSASLATAIFVVVIIQYLLLRRRKRRRRWWWWLFLLRYGESHDITGCRSLRLDDAQRYSTILYRTLRCSAKPCR